MIVVLFANVVFVNIPSITTTESVLIVMILLVGRTGFPVVREKEKREEKKERKREKRKKKERATHTQQLEKKNFFFVYCLFHSIVCRYWACPKFWARAGCG